ncbi:uncharacterized protein LOC125955455 [Anopheles darlingi]|uniref:uncharacterized protein LOC125955455 n=1 Tax=Anopheles darlingi TaxID=43151 RepID=UPI0021005566|nr:uncharacterized protein LOC125955455 [Anopheles darlingi]
MSMLDASLLLPSRTDHLPRLDLPRFSGENADWPAFKTRFERRVQHIVEDADRYAFLAKCFERFQPAREYAESFENARLPFSEAWRRLEERFYKKRLAIAGQFNALLELPKMKEPSAQGIMSMVDRFETASCSARQIAEVPSSDYAVIADGLMVSLAMSKLDESTTARLVRRVDMTEVPRWADLRRELEIIANQLIITPNPTGRRTPAPQGIPPSNRRTVLATTAPNASASHEPKPIMCYACDKNGHVAQTCPELCTRSYEQRLLYISGLAPSTYASSCTDAASSTHASSSTHESSSTHASTPTLDHTVMHEPLALTSLVEGSLPKSYVFLATANIVVQDNYGKPRTVRCIMDSGSQLHCITETALYRLRIPSEKASISLHSVNGTTAVRRKASITLYDMHGGYACTATFYVVPSLMTSPAKSFERDTFQLPTEMKLADTTFYQAGTIEAILVASVFFLALRPGRLELPSGPVLQESIFGWLVGGLLKGQPTKSRNPNCLLSHQGIDGSIERFWKIEDASYEAPVYEIAENYAEDHFKANLSIAPDGRYVVRIPLQGEPEQLGDSFTNASKRLRSLERRLVKDDQLYADYRQFMKEYLALGHMVPVKSEEVHKVQYFIPHSCVVKPDSTTTKLRVVFDASAKSSSGVSLNDLQLIGPVI